MSDYDMTEYSIQPGDTLWDIADQFESSAEEIMDANPGVDFNNLMVGQPVTVPHRPAERRPGERRPEYRRPEYFRRPYRRPYYRPYYPYPYRPYARACPFGSTPYSVRPGESLYSIASRFGISVDAIIAANPYVNFGIPLQIGQVICLPA